jgi:hypothetical protein
MIVVVPDGSGTISNSVMSLSNVDVSGNFAGESVSAPPPRVGVPCSCMFLLLWCRPGVSAFVLNWWMRLLWGCPLSPWLGSHSDGDGGGAYLYVSGLGVVDSVVMSMTNVTWTGNRAGEA